MDARTLAELANDNAACYWLAQAEAFGWSTRIRACYAAVRRSGPGGAAHQVLLVRRPEDPVALRGELLELVREWGAGRLCLEDPYRVLDLSAHGCEAGLDMAVMARRPLPATADAAPGCAGGPHARAGDDRPSPYRPEPADFPGADPSRIGSPGSASPGTESPGSASAGGASAGSGPRGAGLPGAAVPGPARGVRDAERTAAARDAQRAGCRTALARPFGAAEAARPLRAPGDAASAPHAGRLDGTRVDRLGGTRADRLDGTQVDRPADLAAAERVVVEGFPVPDRMPWRPGGLFPPRLLEVPGWRAWLVRRGGAPAGACVTYDDGAAVGVYWVAVLPEHRSRGVGRELLRTALADRRDRPAVLTSTLLGEPLYRGAGFGEVGMARWWRHPGSGRP